MDKGILKRVVDISTLDVSQLTENDRVIFSVDVGTMPSKQIMEYFETLKKHVREVIPEPIVVVIKPSSIDISVDRVVE